MNISVNRMEILKKMEKNLLQFTNFSLLIVKTLFDIV